MHEFPRIVVVSRNGPVRGAVPTSVRGTRGGPVTGPDGFPPPPELVVMVGLQASVKSTRVARNLAGTHLEVQGPLAARPAA